MIKQNHKQPSKLALQAASRAIVNSRFFAGGLSDGLSRSQSCQIWLSGAINGMSCALSLLKTAAIHNYQLSIRKPEDMAPASLFAASLSVQVRWISTNVPEKGQNLPFFLLSGSRKRRPWDSRPVVVEIANFSEALRNSRYYHDRPGVPWYALSRLKAKECCGGTPAARRVVSGADQVTRTALVALAAESEVC